MPFEIAYSSPRSDPDVIVLELGQPLTSQAAIAKLGAGFVLRQIYFGTVKLQIEL
jgi:hypothetical protein